MRRMTVTNAGDWLFITTLATRLTKRQAHMRLSFGRKRQALKAFASARIRFGSPSFASGFNLAVTALCCNEFWVTKQRK
jgi:hypothetical protein